MTQHTPRNASCRSLALSRTQDASQDRVDSARRRAPLSVRPVRRASLHFSRVYPLEVSIEVRFPAQELC